MRFRSRVVRRFLLCLAVAFLLTLLSPGGGLGPRIYGPYDSAAFFALAFQMAVVILLAAAFYAAVLFVEHVRRWRRRSRGGRT